MGDGDILQLCGVALSTSSLTQYRVLLNLDPNLVSNEKCAA